MSPVRRREAVEHLCQSFEVSERRACRVVGQPRSTQRYSRSERSLNEALVDRIHTHVRENPRYGYRRVHALLQRDGFSVNHKRVLRLWRQEGFKVPQRAKKRRFLGTSEFGVTQLQASRPNQIWSVDFIFDRDLEGRALKWLTMVDEFTREALIVEVARNIPSRKVVDLFLDVVAVRGVPEFVRSDNGPEYIAEAFRSTLTLLGATNAFIEPGAPWENGYSESFNSRFRDEVLTTIEFVDLRDAAFHGASWKDKYNHRRPHSSLGYRTPVEFAATWTASGASSVGATPLPPTPQSGERTPITRLS